MQFAHKLSLPITFWCYFSFSFFTLRLLNTTESIGEKLTLSFKYKFKEIVSYNPLFSHV